jgi:hypothetical protein
MYVLGVGVAGGMMLAAKQRVQVADLVVRK